MMLTTTISYFKFEEDFVENNIRCIPMVVRLKLDLCGIKLKLAEWSKFSIEERAILAESPCEDQFEISAYKKYLQQLVINHTGYEASELRTAETMEWTILDRIPEIIEEKIKEFRWTLSTHQWNNLNELQRFALVKLSRPGHENANFPLAMKEFNLVS